jgi:hypothetical protein
MVGDRWTTTSRPPKAVGMQTVWIRQGFGGLQVPRSDAYRPDQTIQSLRDLLPVLALTLILNCLEEVLFMDPAGRIILDLAPKPGQPAQQRGRVHHPQGRPPAVRLFALQRKQRRRPRAGQLAAIWSGDGGKPGHRKRSF